MPTISVVLPVYNGESTIGETIGSVLNQSFTDFELIVINDGSTDGTLAVLAEIVDDRLKIFSYANAGLSTSRNRGISHAAGEYIAFIDADDCWTPDKLAGQLNALMANPKAGLAYSWTDFIDVAGQFLRSGIHLSYSGNVYSKLLVYHFLENGSNALIRKSVLMQVGGFDEALTAAEDWDLHLKIAARYEFIAIPAVQILYRKMAQSMSQNTANQEAMSRKVLERAFSLVPDDGHAQKRKSLANLYQYLTFQALEGSPTRAASALALRYLGTAAYYNPSFLRQRAKLVSLLLGKIVTHMVLPGDQAQGVVRTIKQMVQRG